MNKEELEKEANKALDKRMGTVCYINRMNVQIPYTDGYKDSAEPREKRIAELEKKNRELEDRLCNVANYLLDSWCRNKDDYCPHLAKLEKENAELKAQIEKMKCCYNCKHSRTEYEHCRTNKHEKWEIKEK